MTAWLIVGAAVSLVASLLVGRLLSQRDADAAVARMFTGRWPTEVRDGTNSERGEGA